MRLLTPRSNQLSYTGFKLNARGNKGYNIVKQKFNFGTLPRTETHVSLYNLPVEAGAFGPVPAGTGTMTSEIYDIN